MTNFRLPVPREECKQVVKGAFEQTDAIEEYYDGGDHIIGLSRSTFTNYAEWVRVDIPEQQTATDETKVRVPPEEDLSVTTTTQPQCSKTKFLRTLDEMRDHDNPLELVESY